MKYIMSCYKQKKNNRSCYQDRIKTFPFQRDCTSLGKHWDKRRVKNLILGKCPISPKKGHKCLPEKLRFLRNFVPDILKLRALLPGSLSPLPGSLAPPLVPTFLPPSSAALSYGCHLTTMVYLPVDSTGPQYCR